LEACRTSFKEAVQQGTAEVVKKLSAAIHRVSTENKLLKLQNEGLLASLDTQIKRTRNGRRLPLLGKKKQPTDATLFSPCKIQEALEIRRWKDEEKLEKAA
jgi:regulator of replication initiation timing